MAKKTEAAAEQTAVAEVPKAGEIVGGDLGELAQYAGQGGLDKLGGDDVRPPRLLLAQSMSPQVKRSETTYIEGLQERNLFNSLSQQVYGDGPIDIVVIAVLGARGVQFGEKLGDPIIDRNVPLDDPRMQFTTNPDNPKERIKPIATKFYDYLVWLPEYQEGPLALSMKGTQLNVAVQMNSLIKYQLKTDAGAMMLKPPVFARTFALGTIDDKRDKFNFANFTVKLKGKTPEKDWPFYAELSKAYESKNIVIDRDEADAATDNVPF